MCAIPTTEASVRVSAFGMRLHAEEKREPHRCVGAASCIATKYELSRPPNDAKEEGGGESEKPV